MLLNEENSEKSKKEEDRMVLIPEVERDLIILVN